MIGAFTEAKLSYIRKLQSELRAVLGTVSTTTPCRPEQAEAHWKAVGGAMRIEELIAEEFDRLAELIEQEHAA